jgi:hypothetical protein
MVAHSKITNPHHTKNEFYLPVFWLWELCRTQVVMLVPLKQIRAAMRAFARMLDPYVLLEVLLEVSCFDDLTVSSSFSVKSDGKQNDGPRRNGKGKLAGTTPVTVSGELFAVLQDLFKKGFSVTFVPCAEATVPTLCSVKRVTTSADVASAKLPGWTNTQKAAKQKLWLSRKKQPVVSTLLLEVIQSFPLAEIESRFYCRVHHFDAFEA